MTLRASLAVRVLLHATVAAGAFRGPATAAAQGAADSVRADERWSSCLPLLKEVATKRGIELPLPFGAGFVLYHLDRAIEVTDIRLSRGGPPASVSRFAQLGSSSNVENLNVKLDAWILPFLNVYWIGGYIWNQSETTVSVSLPPLLPGGSERQRRVTIPTEIEGSVAGLGLTLAGGYGSYFMIYDASFAQADLGFDDRFKAGVSSVRGGWNGRAGTKPLRAWASVTDWNTFATAKGSVPDPDGGELSFEVDQGPAYRYTYGLGMHYGFERWLELAADGGIDGHGGWYLAVIPVFRF